MGATRGETAWQTMHELGFVLAFVFARGQIRGIHLIAIAVANLARNIVFTHWIRLNEECFWIHVLSLEQLFEILSALIYAIAVVLKRGAVKKRTIVWRLRVRWLMRDTQTELQLVCFFLSWIQQATYFILVDRPLVGLVLIVLYDRPAIFCVDSIALV